MSCECGRIHIIPIKEIIIEYEAVKELSNILQKSGFKNILLVSDENTYDVAGEIIFAQLRNDFCVKAYTYKEKHLIPDETAIGKLVIFFPEETEIIIGVGSGTINDICRFVSHKFDIPYIIAATAPSMDGYASNVSPLIVNGLKTTFEAVTPYAIVGDIHTMKDAPIQMIAAGVGDILGKYTALCDWKISSIVNNEYYCEKVMENTKKSVEKCVAQAQFINQRGEGAIQALMESLVMSGISMSYVGNSRPASGAEHHLAHFWEMMFLFENRTPELHGTKVGISAVIVAEFYQKLLKTPIDFEKAKNSVNDFDYVKWSEKIQEVYKSASPEIINNKDISSRNEKQAVLNRINSYEANWNEIKNTIEEFVPGARKITDVLASTGAPTTPEEINIDSIDIVNGLLYSREARSRFTIMQILKDLNLLEVFAEEYCQHNNYRRR